MECPICYDDITNTTGRVILSCNHSFHLGCIGRWNQTNENCPMCRHELGEKEKIVRPPLAEGKTSAHMMIEEAMLQIRQNVLNDDDFYARFSRNVRHTIIAAPSRGGQHPITFDWGGEGDESPIPFIDENARDEAWERGQRRARTINVGNGVHVQEQDVELVMTQARCDRRTALRSLRDCEGDIVNAIMNLDNRIEDVYSSIDRLAVLFHGVPRTVLNRVYRQNLYHMDNTIAALRARYPFALRAIPVPTPQQVAMWNLQGLFREEQPPPTHVDRGYETD